jgi:hypothetical protein
MEYNILKISFKENFYKNIKDLYFSENKDILYYDNSHMNYIYKVTIDNILYTFYGFYKENYFNIIFDSYDVNLDITIKNKFTLLINLNWKLNKINEDISIWTINFSNKFYGESIILPIRNKMFDNNLSIDDYIKIYSLKKIKVTIKTVKIVEENKNFNILSRFLTLFTISNKQI